MNKKPFLVTILSACLIAILCFSCDDDSVDVGGNILTSSRINTREFSGIKIRTNNSSSSNIQTNGLPFYLLGNDVNPNFGNTDYSILAKVSPTISGILIPNTRVEEDIEVTEISKLTLILPYRYQLGNQNSENGMAVYSVNPIYSTSPLNLDVFNLTQELKDAVIGADNPRYFANGTGENNENLLDNLSDVRININSEAIAPPIDEDFKIKSTDENGAALNRIQIGNEIEKTERVLKIALSPDSFGAELTPTSDLGLKASVFTNKDFTSKFKGIRIAPSSSINNEGLAAVVLDSLFIVTPRIEAVLKIKRTSKDGEGIVTEKVEEGVVVNFNLGRQQINIINHDNEEPLFKENFDSDETIVIKGGAGAIASVKLFDDTTQLDSLFKANTIINNARLRFKINKNSSLFTNVEDLKQLRLVLNNLSNTPLLQNFSENFNEENDSYDLIITNHIQNILRQQELTDFNPELILGISEDSDELGLTRLIREENKEENINVGNLLTTKGIPLYGSSASEENKPKLIINFISK